MAQTNSNLILNASVVIQDVIDGSTNIFNRTIPSFTYSSVTVAEMSSYAVLTGTALVLIPPSNATFHIAAFVYVRNAGTTGTIIVTANTSVVGSQTIIMYLPVGGVFIYGSLGQDINQGAFTNNVSGINALSLSSTGALPATAEYVVVV